MLLLLTSGCSSRGATSDALPTGDGKPGTNWCATDTCPEICQALDCNRTPLEPDDYDGDGLADSQDNCPWIANSSQADGDQDTVGDTCDLCPKVADKDQLDFDGDGMGDACDVDMDNDGLANPGDNCPLFPNLDQADTDGDKAGDLCDDDDDNDKILDRNDNCPLVYNPMQESPQPGTKCDNDTDMDNINDGKDNCAFVANPDQKDLDGDQLGDACDPDIDGDGVPNVADNCPTLANPDQKDGDRDGKGDACDSRFCLVIGGDEVNCLDPQSTFQVYSPLQRVAAGEVAALYIYSNRTDVAMDYQWTVKAGGPGKVIPFNLAGKCGPSASQLCSYPSGKLAGLVVDQPGEYQIKLGATLEQPDPLNPSFPRSASYTVTLVVEGPPSCFPDRCVN